MVVTVAPRRSAWPRSIDANEPLGVPWAEKPSAVGDQPEGFCADRAPDAIEHDIMAARSIIERWGRWHERPTQLTEADLLAVLTEARGLVELLGEADRIERAALYRALGLSIKYEKEAPTRRELVRAQLELCGGGGLILALTTTERAIVPVRAVLWLDDESTA